MANIFDGFKTAIKNYMEVESLPSRTKEKVMSTYSKDYYTMEVINDITSTPLPKDTEE